MLDRGGRTVHKTVLPGPPYDAVAVDRLGNALVTYGSSTHLGMWLGLVSPDGKLSEVFHDPEGTSGPVSVGPDGRIYVVDGLYTLLCLEDGTRSVR